MAVDQKKQIVGLNLEINKSTIYKTTMLLEKKENCIIVEKLRAILLMEANFNFMNKAIIGSLMIGRAEAMDNYPRTQLEDKRIWRRMRWVSLVCLSLTYQGCDSKI